MFGIQTLIRALSPNREIAKPQWDRDTGPKWRIFDQTAAREQGWGLYRVVVAQGVTEWRLQKHDQNPRFTRDEHAWLFVYNQMLAGETTAVRAFDFLEAKSGDEYRAITKFCHLCNGVY